MKKSTLSSLFAFLMATMALPGIAQDTKLPAMNAKQTRLLIDSISNALHRYYIYPDEAAIMGDYLKSRIKSQQKYIRLDIVCYGILFQQCKQIHLPRYPS